VFFFCHRNSRAEPVCRPRRQDGRDLDFQIVGGQPVNARSVGLQDVPQPGEIKVSLQPLTGMTMIITNNTSEWYNYRAFLAAGTDPMGLPTSVCTLMADGRRGVETWPLLPRPSASLVSSAPSQAR
jgi:hypothetical protein